MGAGTLSRALGAVGLVALVASLSGAIGAPVSAQQAQPVVVVPGAVAVSCPIAATQPWAPTPNTGWGVQFTRQLAGGPVEPFGQRDTSSPFRQQTTLTAGSWTIGATWTRSGSQPVTAPPATHVCGGSQPPDPPEPPPVEAPAVLAFDAQPASIVAGSPSLLSWTVRPAGAVTSIAGIGPVTGTTLEVKPTATTTYTLTVSNGTSAATATRTVTVTQPPPPGRRIWGVFDPSTLGTCSLETHEAWVLDGGDGYWYRTWHPQQDPSGCVYGHEHGDDPRGIRDAEIAARPVLFGWIGRRHPMPGEPDGHEEPHEGFKVFVAQLGEVNDEGRVNRVWSRSSFHMGTGGPRRFTTQLHSADIALKHPEFGLKAFTRLMMDTGATGRVCDPRQPAPVKDVIALDFVTVCGKKLPSGYEIWTTQQIVRNAAGQEVYRSFATPAAFDPITVFNPAQPGEVVYAWDPRVATIRQFNDDWTGNRGCDRESYAQPGYWYNRSGATVYYTSATGQPLPSSDPMAIAQELSLSDSVNAPATNDGLSAFKNRPQRWCGRRSSLGLKN